MSPAWEILDTCLYAVARVRMTGVVPPLTHDRDYELEIAYLLTVSITVHFLYSSEKQG